MLNVAVDGFSSSGKGTVCRKLAEKLNVSSQMADRGIMNRDEIREIWNLPPLPNGQGQAYTIRGEYYLLGQDGSVTKKGDDINPAMETITPQ